MKKKNLLTGTDKELQELVDRYEEAQAEGKPLYMDDDDFAYTAFQYMRRSQYDKADEVVEYALKIHPDSTEILMAKAYLCVRTLKVENAKECLRQIGEENDEVRILKANLLYREGKEEEAEAMLDGIEEKEELVNIIGVTYMYMETGCTRKALPWIERGLERYEDDDDFLFTVGDYYFSLGSWKKATAYIDKAIDRNPYCPRYWYGLANCYYRRQMYEKADEALDYVLTIDEEYLVFSDECNTNH